MNSQQASTQITRSAQNAQEAVMTAYSLTGNLASAMDLCKDLVDENLPQEQQAIAVLTKLHNIAMRRPKH